MRFALVCLLLLGGCVDVPQKPKRPIALLFHAGSFTGGSPSEMRSQAKAARRKGFKPVAVNYELGNLPAAVQDAKRAATRYGKRRKVVAYGESAGGGLAAMLASKGKVDSAVTYSGVNNLGKWFAGREDTLGATPAQLRRWSATTKKRSKSPILAYTTRRDDPFSPTAPTRKWAKRDPNVRHRKVGGYHISSIPTEPRAHANALKDALRYLRHETRESRNVRRRK